MAYITENIDTIFVIFNTEADKNTAFGFDSIYTSTEHPSTGNKIAGWKWDENLWAQPEDLDSEEFIPSIFDATESGLQVTDFICGIGDNDDLKLERVTKQIIDNTEYWTPFINHGYYYINNQESYLFSDTYQAEIIRHNNVYSGLQYIDFIYNPKPTVPIMIRSFTWNHNLQRYEIAQNFRKKAEFTGIYTSGEELSTFNNEDLFELANIDITNPEFMLTGAIESGVGLTAYLNKNYSEWIGDESSFSNLEYLYAVESGEYHTKYSPLDLTSGMDVWVDSGTYTPEEWTRIDLETNFTPGPAKEYKVDEILGLVLFGDYTSLNAGGSGLEPAPSYIVGAAYCKTALLEYEPEKTIDIIELRDININSLYNESSNGFIKVKL
jgi:hypothetical protein